MSPDRFLAWITQRLDLVALVAMVVASPLLPGDLPGGVLGLGMISGAELAVAGIGIVLIYRSDRIINFAQVPLGVLAGVLFRLLVQQRTFIRSVRAVCGCVDLDSPGLVTANYWLSMFVSIALALILSFLIYHLVVRRFRSAPRLVLTVVTIGLAGLLASFQAILPRLVATADQKERSSLPRGTAAGSPFDASITIAPTRFDGPDILMVTLAFLALIGLFALLRWSRLGTAIRAAADAPERALSLGIDVFKVGGRVWVVAGALTAAVAIIGAMGTPAQEAGSLSVAATVRILAVAVLARMTSPARAVAAGIAIGILDQAMVWSFESTALADGAFLIVIAMALLLQRTYRSRADDEALSSWKADRELAGVPTELASLGSITTARRLFWFLVGAVTLGFPWAMSPSQTNAAAVVLIYAMVGLSLLVLTGWAGQISLGQFAFAAIGGFVTSILSAQLQFPMLLALVVGAIAGAGSALLVGIPALKVRGLNLAVITMAFSLSTSAILLNPAYLGSSIPETLDRPALLGMDLADQRTFYYITLLALLGAIGLVAGIRKSRTGRALLACRDNDVAAQSFGINLLRVRLSAFAISGALSAFAGGLFAFHQGGVKAAAFAPETSISMFLMAVIGGLGSIGGPIIGAVYVGILNLFSTSPFLTLLGTGGGLVALLLVAPGGLAQVFASVRTAWMRRIAERHNIVVPSLLADEDVEAMTHRRFRILPKTRPGGGEDFVPIRYSLGDQWGIVAGVPEVQEDRVG